MKNVVILKGMIVQSMTFLNGQFCVKAGPHNFITGYLLRFRALD
jgi:hypothetical protein